MKKFLPIVVVAALVFAVYAPAIRAGFVWDDTALILRDPLIRSWQLIPEGFAHYLFTDATPSNFYRPVQRLTYTLEYCAVAVRPMTYHVTSILCHVAAALGLFAFANELLRRFAIDERKRRAIVWLATIVWALHPMHAGAVAYVSGRADPLAAAFGFFGLYFALRIAEGTRRQLWTNGAVAALLFVASALSKEMGLLFPLLWCVLILVRHKWRALLRWAGVTGSVLVVYLALRMPAEHFPVPTIRTPPPLLVRPVLASRAVAEYAALLVFPAKLHAERDLETYPVTSDPASATTAAWRELETLAGIVLIAAFVFWILRERKRDRLVFALLLLTVVAYVPMSGAMLLNASMAEHWIYVPSAFLLLAAGVQVSRLNWSETSRTAAFAVFAICVALLGARTFVRCFDFKDQRTFFERTIASGGDSPRMLINLAGVEMESAKLDDAKQHLQRALEKQPDHPLALLNLGAVAIRQGDYKAAHEFLDRAIKMPVVEAQARELQVVLANKENGTTDLIRMRWATRTGEWPNWWIEKRYIRLLAESGGLDGAIAEAKRVLKDEAYRAETWELLGELLEKAGRKSDAAAAFAQAHDYDVHLDLRPRVL